MPVPGRGPTRGDGYGGLAFQRVLGTRAHTPARPIPFLRDAFREKDLKERLIRDVALIRQRAKLIQQTLRQP